MQEVKERGNHWTEGVDGKLSAIQLLQRFPEKINDLGIQGWYVLHYACEFGHLELVKYVYF